MNFMVLVAHILRLFSEKTDTVDSPRGGTMNSESTPEVLVVGIGNAFRGDDGAGLNAVRALAEREPRGALLVECHGDGTELMNAWRGRSKVILVDAMRAGSRPGSIVRFVLPDEVVPATALGTSAHAFGVREAILLAREIGELPETLVLFGIEGEKFTFGSQMSSELEAGMSSLVELIEAEIEALLTLQAA
jgi:hydrogenase maturation protease